MKNTIIAAMLMVTFMLCLALARQQRLLLSHELYSWQDAHGNWEFSLLYTTSMTKTAKIIFDQQTVLRGIKRLEERMKGLPSGTEIVWIESVPGGDRPRAKG